MKIRHILTVVLAIVLIALFGKLAVSAPWAPEKATVETVNKAGVKVAATVTKPAPVALAQAPIRLYWSTVKVDHKGQPLKTPIKAYEVIAKDARHSNKWARLAYIDVTKQTAQWKAAPKWRVAKAGSRGYRVGDSFCLMLRARNSDANIDGFTNGWGPVIKLPCKSLDH